MNVVAQVNYVAMLKLTDRSVVKVGYSNCQGTLQTLDQRPRTMQ